MAASLIPAGRRIVSIVEDTGVAVVITTGPHGLSVEPTNIVVSGNSVPGYNGPWEASGFDVFAPNSFYINTVYTSDGTGGSWALA